jgi:protein-L-isoaspartate(D-aspartate) O-methyltransferase
MERAAAFADERARMVSEQIAKRGIDDPRVLDALRSVPRHLFVPEALRGRAYMDGPLPIGQGQTISQPYMVAVMSQLLQLHGEETLLEVGCGSGYQAAVLARLAGSVHSLEIIPSLARQAEILLRELAPNVSVHLGDGTRGWPEAAPYQGILVTAAAPEAPRVLLEQLAEGGNLVLPVGGQDGQQLQVWKRHGGRFSCRTLFDVSFVPLRGAAGWTEKDWGNKGNSEK